MKSYCPPSLRDLVAGWRADGSPTQPGTSWRRQQWVDGLPRHLDVLGAMPDLLDRAFLRGVGASAAVDATSAERAFIAVMAWGYAKTPYGQYRTRRALETPRATDRLLVATRALADSGAVAAYRLFAGDCRLAFFGPAFVTKFLSFCQPPGQDPTALILDSLVAAWLRREADMEVDSARWSASTYCRYLDLMSNWAAALDCRPDELECCIFSAMSTERGNEWARPRGTNEHEPPEGSAVATGLRTDAVRPVSRVGGSGVHPGVGLTTTAIGNDTRQGRTEYASG